MKYIKNIFNKKMIALYITFVFLLLYFILPYSFLTICSGSMSKTIKMK